MSRKSARIAAKPPQKLAVDVDDDDEVEEEEEPVKTKGKKTAATGEAKGKRKGKGKAKAEEKADAREEENKEEKEDADDESAAKKLKKVDGESPDVSNTAVSLAALAESSKGSRKLAEVLSINPSATTTTVTTHVQPGSSSTSVVTIKELESSGFEKHFGEIADALLNHCVMFIGGLPHRLLEVEFYFNGYNHVDDFAHCHERQKSSTQWYFHMTGSGYKGGSYKGLDVTFGDGTCYGGILLRSLQPLYGDFKPIEGPSLLVDHVLKTTNSLDIKNLVAKFDMSAEIDLSKEDLASPKHPVFLVHSDKEIAGLPKQTVYKGARVGLSMKAFSEGKQNYIGKFYRYLITPDKIKKGRHYFVTSLYQQGHTPKQIVELTKSTSSSVEKIISLYDGGKTKDFKKYTGVNLSNDEVCELIGSCAAFCYPPPK